MYKFIYSDSEDEDDNVNLKQDLVATVNVGDWVAVIYDESWYPGMFKKF